MKPVLSGTDIPPEHLVSPLRGFLIAPLSLGWEYPWQEEVRWSAALGEMLERGWMEPLPCAPLLALYPRGRGVNELQGWCIDV